jgi:hypothetical protein
MLFELTRILENEKSIPDDKELIELMQDLDLFLFREITVKNRLIEGGKARKTNVLAEALHRGFDKAVDFIFSEGFSNVRSALKLNNPLEIENQVAVFNISFFKTHLSQGLNFLKKIYTNLIDIMQLSNFLDLFSFALENPSKEASQIFEFILTDSKFLSLFTLSLEL